MDMVRQHQNQAGHPNPQGVERYGGTRKVKVILNVKRDIPSAIQEKYGIPISLHIERLVVEDEKGKRTYSDIRWIKGGWGHLEGTWGEYYVHHIDSSDIKVADEIIKAVISQYKTRKSNPPKVPLEIEINKIEFDWEILQNSEERLWRFETHICVRYHWENGSKAIKLAVKFPDGEIDAHPLTKVYWGDWIVNSVAQFLTENEIFSPQTYILDKRG